MTDFGIAKAAYAGAADPTTTGRVLGSVPYLAPEQVEGKPLDARTDVYAAGAMLYELLTGRTPFVAETDLAAAMLRLTSDPIPPRAVRSGIPRGLDATACGRSPGTRTRRFATAAEMAVALSRVRGRRGGRWTTPVSPRNPRATGVLPFVDGGAAPRRCSPPPW